MRGTRPAAALLPLLLPLLFLLGTTPAATAQTAFPARALEDLGANLTASALPSGSLLAVALLEDFNGLALKHDVAAGFLAGYRAANEWLYPATSFALQPVMLDTEGAIHRVVQQTVSAQSDFGVVAQTGPFFVQEAVPSTFPTFGMGRGPRVASLLTAPSDGSLNGERFYTDVPSQVGRWRLATRLARHFGWRAVSVVHLANIHGQQETATLRIAAAEVGLDIGLVTSFSNEQELRLALTALNSAHARGIIVIPGTQFVSALVELAESLNMLHGSGHVLIVAVASHGSFTPDLATRAAGVYTVTPFVRQDATRWDAFAASYAAAPRHPELALASAAATLPAAAGYRMATALALAVNATVAAGGDPRNGTALQASLAAVSLDTPLGPLSFNEDGSGRTPFALSVATSLGVHDPVVVLDNLDEGASLLRDTFDTAPLVYPAGYSRDSPPPAYAVEGCAPHGRRSETRPSECESCPAGRINNKSDNVDECVTCGEGTELTGVADLACRPCADGWLWVAGEPPFCQPPVVRSSETNVGLVVAVVFGVAATAALVGWLLLRHLQHLRNLELRKEIAEKRAEEEARFVAFVFHELRNPLNGVNSYVRFSHTELTQLWRRASVGSPAGATAPPTPSPAAGASAEALSLVLDDMTSALVSCDRVVEVLDNVMELSKLATDSAAARLLPFSVRRVCEQLHSMLRGVNRAIDVRLELDDELPPLLLGDPSKLKHILHNLITNACSCTAQGFVCLSARVVSRSRLVSMTGPESGAPLLAAGKRRLSGSATAAAAASSSAAPSRTLGRSGAAPGASVRAEAADEACEQVAVLFEVTDTGVGMSDEVRQRLFEKYFSGSHDRGTGLGLYIADRFSRLMGSEIKVESPWSSEHTGSRFYFEVAFPVPAEPASRAGKGRVAAGHPVPGEVEMATLEEPGGGGGGGGVESVHAAEMAALVPHLPHAAAAAAAEEKAVPAAVPAAVLQPVPPASPRMALPPLAPRGRSPPQPVVVPAGPAVAPATPTGALRGWRVLLMDDVAMNRKILRRVFSRIEQFRGLDWDISEACNGEEALRMMEQDGKWFNLVVADQIMAGSGGKLLGSEVVTRVRERDLSRSPEGVAPVLVMSSGNSSDDDCAHYMECGADAVWTKPLPSASEMLQQLLEIVQGGGV